jgi:hypothetical protein
MNKDGFTDIIFAQSGQSLDTSGALIYFGEPLGKIFRGAIQAPAGLWYSRHHAGDRAHADTLATCHRRGKFALVLGLDSGVSINNDLSMLRVYHRLGVRKLA